MKAYIAIIVVALVLVVLTDLLTVFWLSRAPASWDLTGNYWLTVAVPCMLPIITLAGLILRPIRRGALQFPFLFWGVYVTGLSIWLTFLAGNPMQPTLTYAGIATVMCAVVFALLRRGYQATP